MRSRPPTSATIRMRVVAIAACLAPAVLVAACGSSHHGPPPVSPASLAPASAPFYAEALVKPTGSLQREANAAGRTLTHSQEPFAGLVHALEGTPLLAHIDYATQIAPWLGERMGIFITSFSAPAQGGAAAVQQLQAGISPESVAAAALSLLPLSAKDMQGAVVLQAADAGKAASFVSSQAAARHAHPAVYHGQSFELGTEGLAWGLVGHNVVVGSQSGVDAAIEAAHGAPALAGAAVYAKLAKVAPVGALASAYVDFGALSSAERKRAGGALIEALLPGLQQAHLSLAASKSAVTLNVDEISSAPPSGEEAAAALGELPSGSWLAIGSAKLSSALPGNLALLSGITSLASSNVLSSVGGPGLAAFFKRLEAHGPQLGSALAGWAGRGGLFVSGSGLLDLQAGLVIDSSNDAAARAAVGKLAALMHAAGAAVAPTSIAGASAAVTLRVNGFPLTFDMAAGHGKFVIGAGAASVTAALGAASTLASSPAHTAAEAALNHEGKPIALVQFPTLVGFLEGLGLTEDPSISAVLPYVRSLGSLTAGRQIMPGAIERTRVVLGLQQPEESG